MGTTKTSKIIKSLIRITIYILLVLLIFVLGTMSYNFGRDVFSDEGYEKAPGIEVVITVEPGDSIRDVADMLYNNGVIGNTNVFYVQALIYEADFKAGTYTVNSSSSGEDIIEMLSSEKSTEE